MPQCTTGRERANHDHRRQQHREVGAAEAGVSKQRSRADRGEARSSLGAMRPPVPGGEQQCSAGEGDGGEEDRRQGKGLLAELQVRVAEPFDGNDGERAWLLHAEHGRAQGQLLCAE